MLDDEAIDLIKRRMALFMQERSRAFGDERARVVNPFALHGLGRSGAAMEALQRLHQDELARAFQALWEAILGQLPASDAGSTEDLARQLKELLAQSLGEIAGQLNSALGKHAGAMGITSEWNVAGEHDLLLERGALEIDMLLKARSNKGIVHLPRTSERIVIEGGGTEHPRVFISYSWDDEEHKEWVKQLATKLRSDGVDVSLDRWDIQPGDQLTEFMERAIRDNDFVLIICTAQYKHRSDGRTGGVGYEGNIMTAEVLAMGNERKFIPILRGPDWRSSAPTSLSGKSYIDLRGSPYSQGQYEELLATLHGRRAGAPPLGPPPVAPPLPIGRPIAGGVDPVWKSSSFIGDDEALVTIPTSAGGPAALMWRNGAQAFIRVIPPADALEHTHRDLLERTTRATPLLPPHYDRPGPVEQFPNQSGVVVLNAARPADHGAIDRFTQVFLNGEIWGIDGRLLRKTELGRPCIAATAMEQLFLKTLTGYLSFAQHGLELEPPLRVVCGLSDLKGYCLSMPSGSFEKFAGNIVDDEVIYEAGVASYAVSVVGLLRPLFEKIWGAAGLDYPEARL